MNYFNLSHINAALLLSYANALSGAAGIIAVFAGHTDLAWLLLILAALCDVFDGLVARSKKRTDDAKVIGVIADSVADMISFGVFPAILFVTTTPLSVGTILIALLYVFAAIDRLVLFTAVALRQSSPARTFTGLPVLMGVALMIILYAAFRSFDLYQPVFAVLMMGTAVLYVSKLPIPKPYGIAAYISYILIAVGCTLGIFAW
jgi:CDP-diacylglycerol--serine O-phosphatidyltransferase